MLENLVILSIKSLTLRINMLSKLESSKMPLFFFFCELVSRIGIIRKVIYHFLLPANISFVAMVFELSFIYRDKESRLLNRCFEKYMLKMTDIMFFKVFQKCFDYLTF